MSDEINMDDPFDKYGECPEQIPFSMTKWDVYRDKNGNPVTITEEQCWAIKHAIRTWVAVVKSEIEKKGADEVWPKEETLEEIYSAFHSVSLSKSCLMGRMLYDGRPPLDEAPELVYAAPAYHLHDPNLCPRCGREKRRRAPIVYTSMRDMLPHRVLHGYCDQPHGSDD